MGFSACLMGLVILSGMATSLGAGGGSVFALDSMGAGLGDSEVRTPVSSVALLGWERQGRDHRGLDGSGGDGVFAPAGASFVEDEG